MRIPVKILLTLALLAAAPAYAQNPPPAAQDQPPPAPNAPPGRVGRVAFASGNVAIYQLGQTDWTKATVNQPVASGDWFATDPQARAELRVGPDLIDLANNTEINIADLHEGVMQVALQQGRLDLHLRDLAKGENDEIDLLVGGVYLLQAGVYDIALGTNGQPTRVSAFEGSARFVGGGVDKTVNSGEALVLTGSGANLTATVENAAPDEFAQWCRSRDYQEAKLAAPYHVSRHMTGYEELDRYGRWQTAAQYGEVWYPSSVPVGWIPYRDGYWDWTTPWGWSWVDNEPWGFAPFHYGRWAYLDGLWGWVPGAYVPEPVYAPGLVGWLADPNAVVATALSGPGVGWFPLGPGEAYYPSYSRDSGYIRAVNAGSVSDPARLGAAANGGGTTQAQFANRRFATVVPQQAFTGGAIAARAALPVSDPAVQRAAVSTRPTAPQPTPSASVAARAAARNPGAPNFSRLSGPGGRAAANAAGQQPGANGAATAATAGRGGPPDAPNFAHLAPTPGSGAALGAAAAVAGTRGANAARLGPTVGARRSAQGARVTAPRAAVRGPAGGRTAGAARFAAGRGVAGRAHVAAPRGMARGFAGPRAGGSRITGPRMAAPHFAGPRMAAPHMSVGPRSAGPARGFGGGGGPHGGPPGGGHGGGGGPPGGGPHAGGGGPHGGPPGGAPHGGGGGGPHGGGGDGGKHH